MGVKQNGEHSYMMKRMEERANRIGERGGPFVVDEEEG
jgi:hypothetical protein